MEWAQEWFKINGVSKPTDRPENQLPVFHSGLGHSLPQKPKTKVDCFGLFWIVSDRFGSFSDRCNFRTRYPIVSDYFRIVFGRIRGRAMYTEAPLIGTAHGQHRLLRIPVKPHAALCNPVEPYEALSSPIKPYEALWFSETL